MMARKARKSKPAWTNTDQYGNRYLKHDDTRTVWKAHCSFSERDMLSRHIPLPGSTVVLDDGSKYTVQFTSFVGLRRTGDIGLIPEE